MAGGAPVRYLLERFCYAPAATFGFIGLPDGTRLYTVEAPWSDNRVGESCIPEGDYPLALGRYYEGGYDTLVIPDGEVSGRTAIKVHAANRASELRGCIAPGLELGVLEGEWAVLQSRPALDLWLATAYPGEPHTLRITHYRPPGVGPAGTTPRSGRGPSGLQQLLI